MYKIAYSDTPYSFFQFATQKMYLTMNIPHGISAISLIILYRLFFMPGMWTGT